MDILFQQGSYNQAFCEAFERLDKENDELKEKLKTTEERLDRLVKRQNKFCFNLLLVNKYNFSEELIKEIMDKYDDNMFGENADLLSITGKICEITEEILKKKEKKPKE